MGSRSDGDLPFITGQKLYGRLDEQNPDLPSESTGLSLSLLPVQSGKTKATECEVALSIPLSKQGPSTLQLSSLPYRTHSVTPLL